ncbi:hypothetical protein ASG31_08350 [Chryseobacterium sp. Leaf404]|uniref:hypothetical protein n=1 Tax=unclassified Chryseobacterium TaxID=2593645 RepID=UPI0006F3F988|nr:MULTISPECIES: hypothetical protein [unclassified Chryseobacterium]KQT17412.1 hypothetical protein ASG31_08350 [Chryseobacterium sp. Leaf404]
MTPQESESVIRGKAYRVKNYIEQQLPKKKANMMIRYVNGNFRAQGFQGTYFKKWKPTKKKKGRILIESGRLRAATRVIIGVGEVTLRNDMPYAQVHNEGFKGKMSVKAHQRNRYSKGKVGTGKFTKTGKERQKTVKFKSGEGSVRAHTRKVNIPRRQFIPTAKRPSKTLENSLLKMINKDIQEIIK